MKKFIFLTYKSLVEVSVKLNLGKIPFIIFFHRYVYRLFKPKYVKMFGFKLYVNPNDKVLSDSIIRDGIWEKEETEFVKSYIKRNWVVLDIGANIGYFTLIFSKLVGKNGKVFAFEPDPDNFEILKRNIVENHIKT